MSDMDNMDDSENAAKISDSAYSNSCSNSQSRRSHSSKSTHSGSNSSGSSGYGGNPSTGSSNKLEQTSKKDKDAKKKKQPLSQTEQKSKLSVLLECRPPEPLPITDKPKEDLNDVVESPLPPLSLPENAHTADSLYVSSMDLSATKDEIRYVINSSIKANAIVSLDTACQASGFNSEGFICAISMLDGVVMYATQSMTTNLGYPKDMCVGKSFIEFVHPNDRTSFASQITNGLVVPNIMAQPNNGLADCSMVCRIRRYRTLNTGFAIMDRTINYGPFLLKFSFKHMNAVDDKVVFLIIQATPFYAAYKTPNECLVNATPFIIKHSAAGILEYIDVNSVPFLGYIPQNMQNQNALQLYHPEDLPYLKLVYEAIMKEGYVAKSMPFRMLTQNGDYVKLESEWSSFINPWSMKLEFIIGKHHVLEGPTTPDVFLPPPAAKPPKTITDEEKLSAETAEAHRKAIMEMLNQVFVKPKTPKEVIIKRSEAIAVIVENMVTEPPPPKPEVKEIEKEKEEELNVDLQDPDLNNDLNERDSVMLGSISPHHEHTDSKSSTETPLSYNQLNFSENLQRYFDSHQNYLECGSPPLLTFMDSTNPFLEPKPVDLTNNSLMSPIAQQSNESVEMDSTNSSNAMAMNCFSPSAPDDDFQSPRLTETILTQHNTDMEKELAKNRREVRATTKNERSSETRQKKKEHLARCNATFQPTLAGIAAEAIQNQQQGSKRPSKAIDNEIARKQQCTTTRQIHRHQSQNSSATPVAPAATKTPTAPAATKAPMAPAAPKAPAAPSAPVAPAAPAAPTAPLLTTPTTAAPTQNIWPAVSTAAQINNMNSFAQGMQAQRMNMMPPHIPGGGAMPMFYPPAPVHPTAQMKPTPTVSAQHVQQPNINRPQYPRVQQPMPMQPFPNGPMPWMFPQPVYGSPYMYPQLPYGMQHQQALMAPAYNPANPVPLSAKIYEQACKMEEPYKPWPSQPSQVSSNTRKRLLARVAASMKKDLKAKGEATAPNRETVRSVKKTKEKDKGQTTGASVQSQQPVKSEPQKETVAPAFSAPSAPSAPMALSTSSAPSAPSAPSTKTGSGQNSDEAMEKTDGESSYSSFYSSFFKTESGSAEDSDPKKSCNEPEKKFPRRSNQAPWTEKVKVTPELVYKYQVPKKSAEEVFKADDERMKTLEQPALVNEQLGQLYLDLQLEGVTSRLTLEEGISSASSSSEDCFTVPLRKAPRRKRQYSKLSMIYEEDAPLPPPDTKDEAKEKSEGKDDKMKP